MKGSTINILRIALQKMKNNKTPEIDGFPADFYKVFWIKIKSIICRAINSCYEAGKLSVSMRKSIISCLPKGDKSRELLKNWRPISLLSVVYKLASSVIANRLKTVLDKLISKTQTGFIEGRFIGESTRLVYDVMQFTEEKNIPGLLMLIDFEKAFDTVSWKFMYKVFQFFGFGKSFMRWIELFNTDFTASILQVGVLSEPFSICRGCKQGDPIAALEYILCGEMLSLMIKKNKNIKGIFIGGSELKLTQFADDTTLILDGSKNSLQAALNTLEVFGSMSGLKMNTSKTKVIWIGRKKYSKDKLKVTTVLEWGEEEFVLLGLNFSVDLSKMVDLNYNKALSKTKKIILAWKKRFLTPMGKVTIIKTFILSKFNHLFMSLPSPNDFFLKQFSKILYGYLWDDKPDKIKRLQLTQDYLDGGIKMIDIANYICSIKITWIRRLINSDQCDWVKLFENNITKIKKIVTLGPSWCREISKNIKNVFWKEVLTFWCSFCQNNFINNNSQIMSTPIWCNPKISKQQLFFSKWYKNGIFYVGDLVNNEGKILSQREISGKFNLHDINYLEYFRVRSAIKLFVSNFKNGDIFNFTLPCIPNHLEILLKQKKGSRYVYNILNKQTLNLKYKSKWDRDLSNNISEEQWKLIFKACFKTVKDNFLVWFQYRIIHRILGTNKLLFEMKLKESPLCSFCHSENETLMHIFVTCPNISQFWRDIEEWVLRKTKYNLSLSQQDIILGSTHVEPFFLPINTLIMVAKYYIFTSSKTDRVPNIFELQKRVRVIYEEQNLVAKLDSKQFQFNKKWETFENIFIDI